MRRKRLLSRRRSGCPLNASIEMLGDRWSLLIIRDMMVRGSRTFKEFLASDEGIATNILADRLKKLEGHSILVAEVDPSDGRKQLYTLTEKGIDLAPVLSEMVLWAAKHEQTGNQPLIHALRTDRCAFETALRERWSAKASATRP